MSFGRLCETGLGYAFEELEPSDAVTIACRLQDELGAEGMSMLEVEVR